MAFDVAFDPAQLADLAPIVLYAIAFLAAWGESIPVIGLFLPGQTLIVAAAFLSAQGTASPWVVWAFVAAGSTTGDLIGYGLGRKYGFAFADRWKRFRLTPERREQAQRIIERHGVKAILFGRLQPLTRSFGPYVAGACGMGFPRFLVANVIGSAVAASLLVAGGYAAGLGFALLGQVIGLSLVIGFAALVLLGFTYWFLTRRLRLLQPASLTLFLVAAACVAALAALASRVAPAPGIVDAFVAGHLPEPSPSTLAGLRLLAGVGDLYLLAAAFVAIAAGLAFARRWNETYVALAAGPALVGAVFALKWLVPRQPPLHATPHLPFSSFPNEVAALVPALVWLLAWLARGRLRSPAARWTLAGGIALATAAVASPLFLGRAWLTDLLAGVALGIGWLSLVLVGARVADAVGLGGAPDERPARWPWIDRAGVHVSAILHRLFRPALLAVLLATGFLVHLFSAGNGLSEEGARQAAIAWQWTEGLAFEAPWGDAGTSGAAVPSHHDAPLPLLWTGLFVAAFGYNGAAVHAAALTASAAALLLTWWCGRDLYGKVGGLAAAAAVALDPLVAFAAGRADSDPLALAILAPALWATIKSVGRPRLAVAAGALFGLASLVRYDLAMVAMVLAGAAAARRVLHHGRPLTRHQVGGAVAFLAVTMPWLARSALVAGTWVPSQHVMTAAASAAADPLEAVLRTLLVFLLLAGFGLLVLHGGLPWLPDLARAARHPERDAVLVTTILVVLATSSMAAAGLWLAGAPPALASGAILILPLAWLVVDRADLARPRTRAAVVVSFVLLVGGSLVVAAPASTPIDRASDDLGRRLAGGDTVAFSGLAPYRFHLAATDGGRRDVQAVALQDAPDWVVADEGSDVPANYDKVAAYGEQSRVRRSVELWQRLGPD